MINSGKRISSFVCNFEQKRRKGYQGVKGMMMLGSGGRKTEVFLFINPAYKLFEECFVQEESRDFIMGLVNECFRNIF